MKSRFLPVAVILVLFALSCGGGGSGTSQGGGGTQPSNPSVGNTKLSAGWHHTCVVMDDSTVKCWGSNQYGELGDGTTNDSTTPVTVMADAQNPLTGVVAVSASRYYTCALMDDSTVKCWGWNEGGKLGNGKVDHTPFAPLPLPYPDETYSAYPVTVVWENGNPLTGVVSISAGSWHACAVLDDTTVVCWGQNFDGALGIGKDFNSFDPLNPDWTLLLSPYPVRVVDGPGSTTPLTGVKQVAAGSSDHTCALLESGKIRCWGWNGGGEGQLGNGDVTTTYAIAPQPPVQDSAGQEITNAVQIAAGGDHTCALLDDSSVVCWGWNDYGQIGNDNAGTNAPRAVAVLDEKGNKLTGVESIFSERGNHTCALKTDGTVVCWGDNSHGQIGNGSSGGYVAHAVSVSGLTDVVVLAVGGGGRDPLSNAPVQYDGDHTCAETKTGEIYCWGSNDSGQLGDGTTQDRSTPTLVQGL